MLKDVGMTVLKSRETSAVYKVCKNIFIKMLKDVGMAVPKTREIGWYICRKTKDYGIQQ